MKSDKIKEVLEQYPPASPVLRDILLHAASPAYKEKCTRIAAIEARAGNRIGFIGAILGISMALLAIHVHQVVKQVDLPWYICCLALVLGSALGFLGGYFRGKDFWTESDWKLFRGK